MEELNIFIYTTQDSKTRLKTIVICKTPFEALEAFDTPDSHSKQTDSSNASTNASESDDQIASDKDNQSHAQNQNTNATNATNDTLHTSYNPKPIIYRLWDSDTWGCENCSLKGDIHEMRDHACH